jgi:hypothetical protein
MVRAGSDQRFSIDGGRAGWVNFVDEGRHAQLEWEMLVGEIAMVVYGERCFWRAPQARAMTRDEVRQVVGQLATALPAPVEIAFGDGNEIVRPGTPQSERRP